MDVVISLIAFVLYLVVVFLIKWKISSKYKYGNTFCNSNSNLLLPSGSISRDKDKNQQGPRPRDSES
jgi:ribosome biogenesis protein Tsr3